MILVKRKIRFSKKVIFWIEDSILFEGPGGDPQEGDRGQKDHRGADSHAQPRG